ncbi:MAG: hypothetical protein WC807_20305 [Hyphomicrobium sp.]
MTKVAAEGFGMLRISVSLATIGCVWGLWPHARQRPASPVTVPRLRSSRERDQPD